MTLVRNDIPQSAAYQIVALFVENKTAVKINNLTMTHWLNILCKRGGIKWQNCCPLTVYVRHAVAHMHFHIPEFINPENWPANSQYLNPVEFSAWSVLQQKLYR